MPRLVIPQAQLQAPGAPQGPRVNPAAFGGAGAALVQVGSFLQEEADTFKRQRQATQLAMARADAQTEINTFLQDTSRERDFESFPARWEEFYTGLEGRLRQEVDDPEVFAALEPSLATMRGNGSIRLRDMAFAREDDHNTAQLTLSMHNLTNAAAQANRPEEFEFLQDQIRVSVGGAVEAGTLSETAGVELVLGSLADTESLRVQRMIEQDPFSVGSLLADPEQFPNLTAEQRFSLGRLADNEIERQIRASNAAANAAANAAEQEYQDQLDEESRDIRMRIALGESVTPDEVRRLAPLLDDNAEFGRLLSAYEGQEDPQAARTYAGLDNMARSASVPEDIFRGILDSALESDQITSGEYDRLRDRYAGGVDAPPTPYDLVANTLERGLGASEFDPFEDRASVEQRRGNALIEYYQRATPDMSPEELQALGDELLDKYGGVTLDDLIQPEQPAPQVEAPPEVGVSTQSLRDTVPPPRPPGAEGWNVQSVQPADIQAWAERRLEWWINRLGTEEQALSNPIFVREMELANEWANIAGSP